MIKAPRKEKPTVAFVATARFAEKGFIDQASQALSALNFKVLNPPKLYAKANQFGGSDDERFENFRWAWENPDIDVIWVVRGGYGSIRICDRIQTLIQNSKLKKWVVGYSDVTAIHGVLSRAQLCSIHGTMPVNFAKNHASSIEEIANILQGKAPKNLVWDSHPFNKEGKAKGKLVGGNLSMLYSLQGTPFHPPYESNILFFEDLDEYLYHIDRILQNLQHSGVLRSISGMVVGQLSDMHDNAIPFGKNAEEIVNSYSHLLNIPVAFNAGFGHIENNHPLVHGAAVELIVDADKTHLNYVDSDW